MTRIATILGLLTAVLLGGACAGTIPRISPGRPAFASGSPESYWIWHDPAGWHLRTTTRAQLHRFHGWVEAIDGRIGEVHPSRLEWNDRIRIAPRGIEFDFSTDGGEDGFDWRVSSGCNRFYLQVDGVAAPERVHLGGQSHVPVEMPFARCR